MLDHSHALFGVLLLAASFSSTRLFWMSNRLMSPTTDSSQKEERPWPTVSRSTRPSRRYADSSEGIVRCVLYRADVKLRACSGRERPEQPKSKLFAKLAVELFVLNLIRAFVGVCGHVVSELRVCGVFAMQDHSHGWFGVLLFVASWPSARHLCMSNRLMSPRTGSDQREERPLPTASRSTRPSHRYAD